MTIDPATFETGLPAGSTRLEIALADANTVIAARDGEISYLNDRLESQTKQINRYAGEQSEFESRLKEAVENDEIDSDLAKEFADIFGLELTKTYNITITASWSGTVVVPFGQNIDDLDLTVNYPEVSYSCDEFELDVDEDELDHEVSEYY